MALENLNNKCCLLRRFGSGRKNGDLEKSDDKKIFPQAEVSVKLLN